jgi:hypothetical protein
MIHIAAQVVTQPQTDGDFEATQHQVSLAEALTLEVANDVCLKVSFKGQAITLDARLLYAQPDMAVGYLGLEDQIELVWDSERFSARDAASSVAERKGVTDLTRYLFIVAFDGEDIFFITRHQIVAPPEGASHTPIVRDGLDFMRPRQWVAAQRSALFSLSVKNKAKRRLLSQVKAEDSLAALEKQVDLLSQLVITMAQSLPSDQRPTWLDSFQTNLSQDTSTQFMGEVVSVADIHAHKTRMRTLQSAYFAQRSEVL